MRLLDRLVAKVEKADTLDGPADKLAAATDSTMSQPTVRDGLSGTWLGHPLHPLMVTVPIGSWTAASVLDFTGGEDMHKAARRLVGLGVLAALPTAAAGVSDWRYTVGPERRVGVAHAMFNNAALGLYGASWLMRRRGRQTSGAVLALAGAALMGAGGYLGGHLSYAMGVGVDTTSFDGVPTDWVDACPEGDVPYEGMVACDVNGTSVLLTRSAGRIVGLHNRCTHRGGPLADGSLEGDCVRCPWHDSLFSLADGEVKEGPATRPQPALDVRVEAGRVLVRQRDASGLQKNSA